MKAGTPPAWCASPPPPPPARKARWFAPHPGAIIGFWHTPGLTPAAPPAKARVAFAPLRTVDWLARRHPAVAASWTFRQGPAGRGR
ncbi:MAG: hypothetical protein WDM96_02875 [Lacunisphaera sp.]